MKLFWLLYWKCVALAVLLFVAAIVKRSPVLGDAAMIAAGVALAVSIVAVLWADYRRRASE